MTGQKNSFWKSEVIYRQVVEADLPALEWNGQFSHFRNIFHDIFFLSKRGEATLWVAELHEIGIIGQAFVQLKSGRAELADGKYRAYIFGFRVKPDYQGNGVGTGLMQHIETDLVERGFEWAILNVNFDNQQAKTLYERLGYRVVTNEPGNWSYIDDKGKRIEVNEPAWRMEKKLT